MVMLRRAKGKTKMNSSKLQRAIRQKGFTLAEIADKLGITYRSLYNKLNGKTDFTATELQKLLVMLGIIDRELI